MKPITEAIGRAEVDGVWQWTGTCEDSTVAYKDKLKGHRRRYTNPDRVVTKENCLCMLGDADPQAVEVSLWCVQRADVFDVVVEDLETLIWNGMVAGHPPKIIEWLAAELAPFVPVVRVRFFGKYITHCINR